MIQNREEKRPVVYLDDVGQMHMTARIMHGWKMTLSLVVLLVAFIVLLVKVSSMKLTSETLIL